MLFESEIVADVPAPLPVTNTAIYFHLKELVTASVALVALEIFVQVLGTEARTLFNCVVQEYHW